MAPSKLDRIFVTGATGYIGAHVLDQLFTSKRYEVVGAVRSTQRVKGILNIHPEYTNSNVTFAVTPDIAIPGSCDKILEKDDFDYIIHAAGSFRFDVPDVKKDIVSPSYDATKSLVDSAQKFCTTRLKRLIFVSSAAVEILGQRDRATFKKVVTEEDVGQLSLLTALQSGDPFACYIASKIEAENYIWSTVKSSNVLWDVTVFYPTGVSGPLTHPLTKFGGGSHSIDWAYGFLSGKWKTIDMVPLYNIVDVRDVATAIILALHEPKASNERFNLAHSDSLYSHQVLANIIHKRYPELSDLVCRGTPNKLLLEDAQVFTVDSTKSKEVFGDRLNYRSAEEALTPYVEDVWIWMKKLKVRPEGFENDS